MGLGESVAPSAIVDMLARTVPKAERASAMSTAFGGLHVGSIIGLVTAPAIISMFGWQAVFYIFGAAGALHASRAGWKGANAVGTIRLP